MKATVTLHQFPRPRTIANLSPFCMKVETFMKMASVPYVIQETLKAHQGPQRKLPYILHQNKKISDSQQIIEYLTSAFSIPLDQNLTEEQWAMGHTIRVMLEERLRWCIIYSRWLDQSCWLTFQAIVCESLSPPYGTLFPWIAGRRKRRIHQTLYLNGIGRFTPGEVYGFGQKDIAALASILKDRTYLLGDNLSSFDATVYAFLANLIDVPLPCSLNYAAQTHKTLCDYYHRMKRLYKV